MQLLARDWMDDVAISAITGYIRYLGLVYWFSPEGGKN